MEDLQAKLLRMNLEEFSLMTSDNSSEDGDVALRLDGDILVGDKPMEDEQDDDKLW